MFYMGWLCLWFRGFCWPPLLGVYSCFSVFFLFVLHMKMMSGLSFGFRWFLRVFGLSPNIYLRILGLNASVWLKSSMIFVSSENYANFILN